MLRFITAGESHGCCLTAIVEGLPAGLQIDIEQINSELARRQQGFGRGGRMKIEKDYAKIVSGVRFGNSIGSPITLVIENRDWQNWQEKMSALGEETGTKVICPRPGHADLTGVMKYDRQDIRDILERASARETATRVAVGAIAKQLLQACDISITSHITSLGGVAVLTGHYGYGSIKGEIVYSDLACIDLEAAQNMKQVIAQAKKEGNTLGGVFEVVVTKVFPGIGSYVQWDRRLDAQIAAAVMSIPGIKGVEFGLGFKVAQLKGSEVHDEIFYEHGRGYYRKSNNAGGTEGGMSNGEAIIIRAAMKPIPTLMQPLCSVNISTHNAQNANTERSDICAVTAAAVTAEAMTAIVIASLLLDKFSNDNMKELLAAVDTYRQRISNYRINLKVDSYA